jgi:tetratricopeptide (TPR) repeat protein
MTPANLPRLEKAWNKGDLKTAYGLALGMASQGVQHPLPLRIAAEAEMNAGRFAAAGDLLNRALRFNPADPDALCALAVLLHREGRVDESLNVFGQVLNLAPNHARGWLWLGLSLAVLDADGEALKALARAADVAPKDPAPRAVTADILLRAGQLDDAGAMADKALKLDPFHPLANCIKGRVELSHRQTEAARSRMERLLVRGRMSLTERHTALQILGDALDRLGRIPEAFSAYGRMNQAIVEQHRQRLGPGGPVEDHLHFIQRLARAYAAAPAVRWSAAPQEIAPSPVRGHVFVLGYPRSGNTLAASVLGALPGAVVLEERPTLADADWAFLRDEEAVARLADLSGDEAEQQRAAYWARVRQDAPEVDGKLFIDMSPMDGVKLPMIRKLFPRARIVVCRRDPRDVVLSCYRQNFRANASTFQMTSLEGAARHFDAAMQLLQDNLARVGAEGTDWFDLSYEPFVADFEANARRLVAFAGEDWNQAALNFSAAASQRKLRTASAQQVRGGLFDGSGKWKPYAAQLQPVMGLLERWAR